MLLDAYRSGVDGGLDGVQSFVAGLGGNIVLAVAEVGVAVRLKLFPVLLEDLAERRILALLAEFSVEVLLSGGVWLLLRRIFEDAKLLFEDALAEAPSCQSGGTVAHQVAHEVRAVGEDFATDRAKVIVAPLGKTHGNSPAFDEASVLFGCPWCQQLLASTALPVVTTLYREPKCVTWRPVTDLALSACVYAFVN